MVRFACELCNHALSYNKDNFIEQNGSHYAMIRHHDTSNFEFIVTTRNHLSFENIDIPNFVVSKSIDLSIDHFIDLLNNQGSTIIRANDSSKVAINLANNNSATSNSSLFKVNHIDVMEILVLFKTVKNILEKNQYLNKDYSISSEYLDSTDGKHLYISVKVSL
ncbi:hypothetical protein PV433_27890 [Paenibacillus sp. GYB004]|uniref:hypothetical protein n=1 Tax=Paenibacillus sp. GYB004 TaxID=2994393 RepID=UPI002F969690